MRPDSESALDVARCRAQQAATRCFLPLFRAKPEFFLPMYDQSAPQCRSPQGAQCTGSGKYLGACRQWLASKWDIFSLARSSSTSLQHCALESRTNFWPIPSPPVRHGFESSLTCRGGKTVHSRRSLPRSMQGACMTGETRAKCDALRCAHFQQLRRHLNKS